jgi:Na+/H+ antiporter NhaD/arsenite permease-like protein
MIAAVAAFVLALLPATAFAAAGPASPPLTSLAWDLPFVGVLASIALLPMLAEALWHKRMGVICLAWAAAFVVPLAVVVGIDAAFATVWHALLIEYLPFVSLLGVLFVVAGGILVTGGPAGTAWGNTAMLALGMVLAGLMGTTGAAMVLIHPLLRANAYRVQQRHLVLFFMLLVANVGGATTPLGDPPLFLGFLRGVPFGWPFVNLLGPMLIVAVPLLALFFVYDRYLIRRDPTLRPPPEPLRFQGRRNIFLLALVVATVVASGLWHSGEVVLLGQPVETERLISIGVFAVIAVVSVASTPEAVHQGNLFDWHPIQEVAKLFAALFITIAPVMTMLDQGLNGPFAPLLRLTNGADGAPDPIVYFWLTGVLSAVLDNAPTYVVFFELASGDPAHLTGALNTTLVAISAGAVFFGGLTYIGNAPNLMVRAIAARRGVAMPSFFGLSLVAGALLVPCFVVVTLVFLR